MRVYLIACRISCMLSQSEMLLPHSMRPGPEAEAGCAHALLCVLFFVVKNESLPKELDIVWRSGFEKMGCICDGWAWIDS